jgi:hypothetical protein
MKRILLINMLVALLFIAILDTTLFFFLPPGYGWRFPEYRSTLPHDLPGRGLYPKGYFVRHELKGFDIGRNNSGHHQVDGISYPIWSNALGCFDNDHEQSDPYVYFAGDSFTWGYTPFEQKFGTLIEKRTGTPIYKCGVTHTGQQHQLEKLTGIVTETDNSPEAIFVFYSSNDLANDYAHPHSTVINGWQVDTVSLDVKENLVRHSPRKVEKMVQDKLQQINENQKERQHFKNRLINSLKYYSLSTNAISVMLNRSASIIHKSMAANVHDAKRKKNETLRSIYHLKQEKNGIDWRSGNPKALRNEAALIDFAQYSDQIGATFVVVLIPPKANATNLNWYGDVRQFLEKKSIRYLDLASKFKEKGLKAENIYWRGDGHLNPLGNQSVADILIEEFDDIF